MAMSLFIYRIHCKGGLPSKVYKLTIFLLSDLNKEADIKQYPQEL
jgi:hypothetical protein